MVQRSLLFAVALVIQTTAVFAQAHPDLSGLWDIVAVRPAPAAASGGVAALPSSTMTIVQTAASLSVSHTVFEHTTTMTYAFDGRDNINHTGAMTEKTHARWDGPTLVIEGVISQVTSGGYAAWTIKDTYRRSAEGRLMIDRESRAGDGMITKKTIEYVRKKTAGAH